VVASPIRSVRQQYFLIYGVEGSLAPFLPVVLAAHLGLRSDDIGTVVAVGGAAILITPLLLGALADARVRETRLMGGALLVTSLALLAMIGAVGFWPALVLFVLFSLAYEPTKSLQDGLFFATRRTTCGLAEASFHQVRVWGTLGFLVPGGVLWALLSLDADVWIVLVAAAVMATVSALNALRLPRPHAQEGLVADVLPSGPGDMRVALAAAIRTVRGRMALFTVAMLLLQMAMSIYYVFYPLYVTVTVGVDVRWLGLIANLGVALEVGYMALYGWTLTKLGWRRFMISAALVQTLRLLSLALWPTVFTVLGTQVVHGYVVIATLVAARVFFDDAADDRMRHAMQGLYTMLVIGGGRVLGSFIGGLIAARDLQLLFGSGALLCIVATGLLFIAFQHGVDT
jgi:MFS transporter, PPP family, 3-phenylpropionic acid transporter